MNFVLNLHHIYAYLDFDIAPRTSEMIEQLVQQKKLSFFLSIHSIAAVRAGSSTMRCISVARYQD